MYQAKTGRYVYLFTYTQIRVVSQGVALEKSAKWVVGGGFVVVG
jgi:hypothetical protein